MNAKSLAASWWLGPKDQHEAGKLFFLDGVDVTCVRADDYDELWNPGRGR